MSNKNHHSYFYPFVTMVLLFFLVGFLTVVNQQFQFPLQELLLSKATGIKNALATLITFTFFLAYPICGGMASRWVNQCGYQKTLIRALLILFSGLGIFLLSILFQKYIAYSIQISNNVIPIAFVVFLLGSFVIGVSLTIIQVVINPYLIACNVKGTSGVQRQMIGGSSNSIGTSIAPFFVSSIIFGGVSVRTLGISDLIIPFLILMIISVVLAIIISKLFLPNIEGTTNSNRSDKVDKFIWSFSHLKMGVIAIFCYVGAEVAIGANINLYAKNLGGSFSQSATLMASLYWVGMLIGRIISSFFNNITAKVQLTVSSLASLILILFSIIYSNPWLLVVVGLFHSVMWGSIFTLAIDKLGIYTSKGSGVLMIGAIGGGVVPFLMGMVADSMNGNWRWAWIIVIVCELFLVYYAIVGSKVKTVESKLFGN